MLHRTTSNNIYKRFLLFSLFILITILVLRCLETLTVFSHGDALYYHLPFAKVLAETGSYSNAIRNVCGSLQTGAIEILFSIPALLSVNPLTIQISSQLIHFSLGMLLAAGLFFYYFSKINLPIALLSAISALTIAKGTDFFLYAKSDGTVASFSLLTIMLIINDNFLASIKGKWRSIFIGCLLGLIPVIKISGLFVIVPFGIYYIIKERRNPSRIFITTFFGLLFISPIIIRNYYFIKSPFFPGLLSIFPGEASEQVRNWYLKSLSSSLTFSSVREILKDFFLGKAFFVLTIPACFYGIKKKYQSNHIFYISLSILALYLIANGGVPSERFFFTCYFLNIYYLSQFLIESKLNIKYQYFILLLLILADSKIDKSLKRVRNSLFKKYTTNKEMIRDKIPLTRIWDSIKENNSLILSDQFSQYHYAPDGTKIHFPQCNNKTEFLFSCKSENDILRLKDYDYFILARSYKNDCYNYIQDNATLIETINQYRIYKK
ncbi:hypothetical protein HBN50_05540 [Halobacteriovorax sp. GB3]|uniref:hypothetical protein n=1 Tax=Halobacteriovorax sp. GB3 TaxID=2719615 RepID=UPI00235DCB95|nr:hypothetical protein [Halobacteriovorax sp. GB3]MDD0852550.1 hypothetical protein [Halobacteriovorax sp. GB3]